MPRLSLFSALVLVAAFLSASAAPAPSGSADINLDRNLKRKPDDTLVGPGKVAKGNDGPNLSSNEDDVEALGNGYRVHRPENDAVFSPPKFINSGSAHVPASIAQPGADPSGLAPGISVGSGSTKITPDGDAPVPDGQPGFYEKHQLMLNRMYQESWVGTDGVEQQVKQDIVRSLLVATTQANQRKKLNSIADFESMLAQLQTEAQRLLDIARAEQKHTEKMRTLARAPPENRLQELAGALVLVSKYPKKSKELLQLQDLTEIYFNEDSSQTWDQRLEAANAKVALAKEHIEYLDPLIKKLSEKIKNQHRLFPSSIR